MNIVKKTLRRLSLYYLLLIIGIIPCANIIPDSFPTRNISTIYLLILSVCLIRYYSYRVLHSGHLSLMMKAISWMAFLMILFRGLKYSVFAGVGMLARHTWYAYYVPMLLLPLFFFYISLMLSPKRDPHITKKWIWVAAVTAIFILLVLTNDLHQLVFGFQPGFADWDSDYSHGLVFYLITGWQYLLYLAGVIVMVVKSLVGESKRNAWLTAIPFTVGMVMIMLLLTDKMPRINGTNVIEFPEALIFMVAGILECCIQLGLIPTNQGYGKLFAAFPLSVQITDRKGEAIYSSRFAAPLTPGQLSAQDGERIGEHTVLHRMELPGGYGFWQDDITELDSLNDELSQAKEVLAQEAELIRLKNELKEKQTQIEQRTAVYDMIASRTERQSQAISEMAKTARLTSDPAVREKCRRRIILVASFMKRFANLMLLSYESRTVRTEELGLSFSEVLRYLNYCGIPAELVNTADEAVSADAALVVFEIFGGLLLDDLDELYGVFINLSSKNGTICKLTLENIHASIPPKQSGSLSSAGVKAEITNEDDITYISFTLPERRAEA